MTRAAFLCLAAAAALLTSGCTAEVGTPKAVSSGALEKQVSDTLTKQVGQRPDDISCPKNLAAKKGAKVRCVLTAGSDKLGVTVTTKSVSDAGKVNFAIEVDQTAQ